MSAAESPRVARPSVHPFWRVLKPLASLQLTVSLFVCSLVLVFFGTLAQKTTGLWDAVDKYFWSWYVLIDLAPSLEFGKIFLGLPKAWVAPSWLAFPWPAGKLIGGLMFANLLAAHLMRFRFTWKRIGVIVAHAGLLLLFFGEYVTREFQVEQRMVIREGESVNYASDHRMYELALTRSNTDGTDHMAVVPEEKLRRAADRGRVIQNDALPCDVRVDAYYTNSGVRDTAKVTPDEAPAVPATAGIAVSGPEDGGPYTAVRKPDVSGVDQNARNVPAVYVTLLKSGTDQVIGTYLLSNWFDLDPFHPEQRQRQTVTIDGVAYDVELRATRYYKPFSLYLKPDGFRFDKYTGTKTAKNYSSDVIVLDPDRGLDHPVTVRMNDPLRHRGETFYQADFDKRTERATVLQVVRNPGWLIPYIACAMVTLGLLFHFLLTLVTFLTRQARLGGKAAPDAPALPRAGWHWGRLWVPLGAVLVGLLYMGSKARPPANPGKLDLTAVAQLPVVDGGRVKPLDTVARVYLRKISGREELFGVSGDKYPAIRWLMDALTTPFGDEGTAGPAADHQVIRIDNGQVQDLLKLPRREGARYSLKEVAPQWPALVAASKRYDAMKNGEKLRDKADGDRIDRLFESGDRDVFGGQLLETYERIDLYRRICNRRIPLLLPPAAGLEWRSLGEVESGALMEARLRTLGTSGISREQARNILGDLFERLSRPELAEDQRKKLETALDELDRDARPLVPDLLRLDPGVLPAVALLSAYRSQDQSRFDEAVRGLTATTGEALAAGEFGRVKYELFLNNFAPAYYVLHLYALVLILTFFGWAVMAGSPDLADQFRRAAFWLTVVAFLVHTFALVSRMYVSDRWFVFVTNLYSSAVFIGWAGVGIGMLLEYHYRLGLGNALASVLGGGTAIIAHNLAASGDTLEMMQAVLDTNFWLAIHVTTVTFGYSATYVAGLVGILYVVIGLCTPLFRTRDVTYSVSATGVPVRGTDLNKVLGNVLYGIICLATLFSFFGTVSGGIWADQSWGRFWGWDPKENGAVLIVIWNALILHARWCGLVKERGMAVLAIAGNMITTWSWFGTNQLGVGLHAYGFSNTLALGCTVTWAVHLVLIGAGCIPKRFWYGFSGPAKA